MKRFCVLPWKASGGSAPFDRSPSAPVCALLLGLAFWALSRAADKPAASGGWPEITPQERDIKSVPQDPGAVAVLLRNDREGKIVPLADDMVNELKYHWRLKVLKPAGKDFGEIHLRGRKLSRVANLEARTIKPDGTVVPVTKDQIFDKTVIQVGDVKITEKVFNFPAVEPGAILEYRYDRYDNNLYTIAPWYFEGSVFTLSSRVSQAVPDGSGYMVMCDMCEGTKPEVTTWKEGKLKGQMYSVTLRNLPGYQEETLMPPRREVSPRLELTLQSWRGKAWEQLGRQDKFFTDWASVGKYVAFDYQDAIKKGQDVLRPVAESWVQGISDPQEKMRAVFRHVQQDFRYLPWADVVGGSRPLATILKEKTADNEEKAVLLVAALGAVGVESSPALVSGKDVGSLNPKYFGLSQFSHAVAVVPRPGGTPLYLDPTVSYAPFGFMPWKDSGADALLLKGGQGEVSTVPVKNELSTTRYKITVRPRPDTRADLEIEARFSGEDAIDMREEMVPASETGRDDFVKSWLSEARPGATLISQSAENLANVDEPLTLKIKAEVGGLITAAEGVQVIRACVLFCVDSNPVSRAARQHPFYVDRGWNTVQDVLILTPAGMIAGPMPLGTGAKSALGNLGMRCVSRDEEGVACSRQFMAMRERWSAAEGDGIRKMYDQIVEADRTAVTFQVAGTEK